MTYAAFLGNHPNMSLTELRCRIPDLKVLKMFSPTIAIFSTSEELDNNDLNTWGGIFLMAREVEGKPSIKDIPQIILKETEKVKGKTTFALRAYGVDLRTVHNLYRDCKAAFKKAGRPVRYVGNEKKPLVSVQLLTEGLITGKGGAEIILLEDEDNGYLWVGRTMAAQNPNAYTKRDMEKPVRDTRAGLLPPKLAQIMLNYGEWIAREMNPSLKKTLTVYDPFCGTGVIPMETLLRKWNVLASDNSQKAVTGCETNMDWIRKEEKILKKDVSGDVWKHDATKKFDIKDKPDVIVTETMLGPALSERPNQKDASKFRTEVDEMEMAFLKNVAETLPGVPVVMMMPVWYLKTDRLFVERTHKKLADLGFEAVLPPGAPADVPERKSLIYRRPDQFVGREILILKPKVK